jgi:cytochrome c553
MSDEREVWSVVLVKTAFLVAAVAALASAAHAAEPPASIRELVQTCAACHGPAGISQMPGSPSLAGQPDIFTQYQLVFIRDGQRKVEVMQEIAKQLTDDNIRELGAWYASLPPPKGLRPKPPVDDAKVKAVMDPRKCANCHKEDFSGQGETGRIAGQRMDYLVKALHDFRSGARRGRGMGAMMEVSVTLQDRDIDMIARYLAGKP